MDARNLLSLSGVLLILGGAGYYWGMGQSSQPLLGGDNEQLPDYEVSTMDGWQTDEEGRLLRHTVASHAVHYRGSPDKTVVSNPVMTLYREGQPAWRLSARESVGTDQNTEVQLGDQVHAERLTVGAVPVVADMDSLNVHTRSQTMDSNSAVTVHAGDQSHLQARGLDADLKADTLNLHNEVQATYAPAH